ncbi:putative F-box protein [Cardamine amara subsp. amara]|uniref:F-box protein n=1 Tax=Cardamine amara subsp. amara TaxID=228776 RepID=A0ABD1BNX1_CARAN
MKRKKNNNSVGRRKIVRRKTQPSAPTYVGETIPIDLIIEILSRLPAKSIAVFRCVSKQWASLLQRPYFRELFLTSSLSRPCPLFTLRIGNKWHFFSFPQPRDLGENLSVVATDYQYHMSYCEDRYIKICQSVNGFIYLNDIGRGRTVDTINVICNPCTGQHITLPKVRGKGKKKYVLRSFFGYDPIGKQFKVLCITMSYNRHEKPQVLTLGSGKLSWRKIECSFTHYPKGDINGICINGVLYYIAYIENSYNKIICFDVRSEKFSFIEIQNAELLTLINYKGKLGVVLRFEYGGLAELWVLDDAKKVKWSNHIFVLANPVLEGITTSIWATDMGEIAWVSSRWTNPLCISYYNLERQSVRIVDKLWMGRDHQESVFSFTDHIENLMFL